MIDLFTYLSMFMFISPILIGVSAWAAIWLRDHFYEYPLYEDYEQD
ncbi:MAG: hypothetical protein QNK37_25085 [Acidobacteriota bacterium]|nr:hypothetical protein [Acidobacteriota bacterium]